MTGSASAGSSDTRFHLLSIGVLAGAFLPCTSACTAARDGAHIVGDATRELLELPASWSACNGIAELITPPFRLVHSYPCDPDSEGAWRQFYPRPSQKGAELRIGYGAVERRSLWSIDAVPDHPVFFSNVSEEWPALARWTPDYLIQRLGPVPVNHLLEPKRVGTLLSFAEFLESVLSGGRYAGQYLFSFPFSVHAPALQYDYTLPSCFYSWLSLIPDGSIPSGREMFLGQAGTTTPLHQEVLNTDFWMAVIWGRKRWALCPPDSDASLLEGAPNLFDPEVATRLRDRGVSVLFCEQDPGDLLFVPNQWWHQVENVAPTLAVSEVMVHEGNAEIILARLDEVKEELPAHIAVGFKRAIELGRQASRSGRATRLDVPTPG